MKDTVGDKISEDLAAKQMCLNFYHFRTPEPQRREVQGAKVPMRSCGNAEKVKICEGESKCPLTEMLGSSSRLRSLRGRTQTWPHTSQPLLSFSNQNPARDASSPQISVPWSTCFKMLKEQPRKASGLILFSRGSSQPRDPTQISHIEGRLFTRWATREANSTWIFLYSSGCRRALLPDSGLLSMSTAPRVLYFWWVCWGTWAQHPPPPPSWSLAT